MADTNEKEQINERINKEISDEWLARMIRKIYYLERRESLSQAKVDKIMRELYFDISKEEQEKGISSDLEKVEIVKQKLGEYIKMYDKKIDKREIKINKYKQKLVTLSTILSLLITIPVGMIIKSKRDNRETLYKTKRIECCFDAVQGDNNYQYQQNVYTYRTDYQAINPKQDMVKIIDDGAWKIEGIEASKSIKTYSFLDVSYEEIVQSGNIDKYLKGIIPNEEIKYAYQNKLMDVEKEQDRIYRVVREIQDLTEQIVVQHKSDDTAKILIVLLAEILLLSYIIDYYDALMSQEIVGLISEIVASSNLGKEEKMILVELKEKYKQISHLALIVRDEDKKRVRAK